MNDLIVVFVTVGGEEEALNIARTIVEERLAACANIVPAIRSIYRWKGEICDDPELLLIIKTRSQLFPAVQQRIKQLHSYEVAEIIGVPISSGAADYVSWVLENTQDLA
jgi:periplasmic divalent cation tolerance protein